MGPSFTAFNAAVSKLLYKPFLKVPIAAKDILISTRFSSSRFYFRSIYRVYGNAVPVGPAFTPIFIREHREIYAINHFVLRDHEIVGKTVLRKVSLLMYAKY